MPTIKDQIATGLRQLMNDLATGYVAVVMFKTNYNSHDIADLRTRSTACLPLETKPVFVKQNDIPTFLKQTSLNSIIAEAECRGLDTVCWNGNTPIANINGIKRQASGMLFTIYNKMTGVDDPLTIHGVVALASVPQKDRYKILDGKTNLYTYIEQKWIRINGVSWDRCLLGVDLPRYIYPTNH